MSVWDATIDDNTWKAEVLRESDHRGTLVVTKTDDATEILREPVGLSFSAINGPDVDDVNMWQVMVTDAIDHYNAQHKETEQP